MRRPKERAGPLDIETSWKFKYDAGANHDWAPISAATPIHSKIQKILRGVYAFGVGFSLVEIGFLALGCSAMAGTSRRLLALPLTTRVASAPRRFYVVFVT
jgi:hypothetical protein